MRIAFRADATSRIGTGHFMRCMTLAAELKRRGAEVRFVSRDLPAYLRAMLAEKGMEFVALRSETTPSPAGDLLHAHWLGASQDQDAQAAIQALSDHAWDWVIVDHYALDFRWEGALRQVARRIMAIDDIADRRHDCDVLLDQNLYADMQTRYKEKVPANCQLLLGPRYALLRDEFRRLREQVKLRTGGVKRVLVFFGGVDADNYTGLAIEALAQLAVPDLTVDVVIGAQHPRLAEIETECAENGYVCHVQTSRMGELMVAADLAIGAGGSASWERCCVALPSLLVAAADNQIEIARALDSSGACRYLEIFGTLTVAVMRDSIVRLLDSPDRLASMSRTAFALVDGVGVDRVCQELER